MGPIRPLGRAIANSGEGGSNSSGYTVTGLTHGTYDFQVRAVNSVGAGDPGEATGISVLTVPDAVTGLQGTVVLSSGDVTLSWTGSSSNGGSAITRHEYRNRAKDGTYPVTWTSIANSGESGSNNSSYTVTGLTRGTYDFQVRAVNNVGDSDPTEILDVVTLLTAPDAITGLQGTVSGSGEVTLSWTSSNPTVTKHQYQQKKGSSGTYGSWTDITSSAAGEDNDESFEVTGLEHDTYYFKVRAVNSAGNGGESNEASIEVETVPGKPNLQVSYDQVGSNTWQVTLEYAADNHGSSITAYQTKFSNQASALDIPYSNEGGIYESTLAVPSHHSSVGFTLGNTYQITIRAQNTHGWGPDSDTVDLNFVALVPGPVKNLREDGSAYTRPNEVTLGWNSAFARGSAIIRHEYRKRESGGTYPATWKSISDSGEGGVRENQYTIKKLRSGVYDFQVRAVNSVGAGDPLEISDVTALAEPAPPTLNAITSSYTSAGWDLSLSWQWGDDGGSPIIGHDYKVKKDSGSYGVDWVVIPNSAVFAPDVVARDPNEKSYTHRVTSSGTYYFKVAARTTLGRGDSSNEVSVVIRAVVPEAVTNVQGTASGSGGVALSWTGSSFNGGSAIIRHEYRQKLSSGTYPATWTPIAGSGESESNSSGYTVTGLTHGTYDFQVRAVNSVGVSSHGEATGISVLTVPDAVTGLQGAVLSNGDVTLSWTGSSSNGGSVITRHEYRKRESGGSYPATWTPIANSGESGSNNSGYTVTGLNRGTYDFQVRAVNSVGDSDPTEILDVVTLKAPEAVTNVQGTASGNGEVTLSWTGSSSNGGSAITRHEYRQREVVGAIRPLGFP